MVRLLLHFSITYGLCAQAVSPIYSRGYTLVPEPQKLELTGPDFAFDDTWHISVGSGVQAGDVALETLKQTVRRAASFKVNALALRLNEFFEYASAPALVAPYALSAARLQELTDYGLRYHLQIVPYLDAPAHANFILNHEEYKHLRAFP